MAEIKRIRTLRGAGVLAERASKDVAPVFHRFNLVYGFNGSGKSTLSRLFSSLQAGRVQGELPDGCSFEFELSDGAILRSPDQISGLQEKVCVFNADFIERNLRWASGTANSIFYISEEQAEAAAVLKSAEARLPGLTASLHAAEQALADKTRILTAFKRGLARDIAAKIHLPNRKYEAPQLQSDHESLKYDHASILDAKTLDGLEAIASALSPPPTVSVTLVNVVTFVQSVAAARSAAEASIGDAMIAELVAHPEMVPWARAGHEYHARNELESCLFCGQTLTEERRGALAAAFNASLSKFVSSLSAEQRVADAALGELELFIDDCATLRVMPELDSDLRAIQSVAQKTMEIVRSTFAEIKRIYASRQAAPTVAVASSLPDDAAVAQISSDLKKAFEDVQRIIVRHNDAVADFGRHQEAARNSIKRHFLAEGDKEFIETSREADQAQTARDSALAEESKIKKSIADLRNQVRTHGQAALVITKLVRAYLGHSELTVVAAKEGYELQRHGTLVKGQPSEGEKTALALCYFLSTLESDGRSLADLIVVVDDPISSLDTKAMNYACALIHSRLSEARQLFVMTHNQHCMNEFKKYWRSMAYPKSDGVKPTAAFLFLDVKMPSATAARSATLVEMPKLLRDYDSEYHFLCMKVLEFEKAAATYSEYGYLMPNIIRRVLELFLAFKVPGTGPIKDKLEVLTKLHKDLDKTRMVALERLSQVESHTDTMEDFISHSSMTIEETRDANAALLELMEAADENHTRAIRRQCKAAGP